MEAEKPTKPSVIVDAIAKASDKKENIKNPTNIYEVHTFVIHKILDQFFIHSDLSININQTKLLYHTIKMFSKIIFS
jgi:hypothetical protein